MTRLEKELPDLMVHVLSDVWLDHVETFRGLSNIFDTCSAEAGSLPRLFIMCGNFTTRGISQGSSAEIQEYQGW